ncbi:hypothetical protein SAMN00120144_4084 [Hymenobacter roseosalivarius DSM 11622]|uniref:Uncharacterized protein n=1 Tax=Hymenobacter roseosalivarius DSM 11622 TaxID=645990 RepID=A0A1W1W4S3_9BACT|nr:hypothetical protein [Hymenobacter roseosalivarius]SMC00642.1 hypothetical protein SAMN00120144_4084 [Hymenobacter roseosalivarius DSM 11622]
MKVLLLGLLLAFLLAGLPLSLLYTPFFASKASLLVIVGVLLLAVYLINSIFEGEKNP